MVDSSGGCWRKPKGSVTTSAFHEWLTKKKKRDSEWENKSCYVAGQLENQTDGKRLIWDVFYYKGRKKKVGASEPRM